MIVTDMRTARARASRRWRELSAMRRQRESRVCFLPRRHWQWRKLLDRTGTTLADYDLFEVNEAFASQGPRQRQRARDGHGEGQRQRRCNRARPPYRCQWREDFDDAAVCVAGAPAADGAWRCCVWAVAARWLSRLKHSSAGLLFAFLAQSVPVIRRLLCIYRLACGARVSLQQLTSLSMRNAH